jgi:hypothetical protein
MAAALNMYISVWSLNEPLEVGMWYFVWVQVIIFKGSYLIDLYVNS